MGPSLHVFLVMKESMIMFTYLLLVPVWPCITTLHLLPRVWDSWAVVERVNARGTRTSSEADGVRRVHCCGWPASSERVLRGQSNMPGIARWRCGSSVDDEAQCSSMNNEEQCVLLSTNGCTASFAITVVAAFASAHSDQILSNITARGIASWPVP